MATIHTVVDIQIKGDTATSSRVCLDGHTRMFTITKSEPVFGTTHQTPT